MLTGCCIITSAPLTLLAGKGRGFAFKASLDQLPLFLRIKRRRKTVSEHMQNASLRPRAANKPLSELPMRINEAVVKKAIWSMIEH